MWRSRSRRFQCLVAIGGSTSTSTLAGRMMMPCFGSASSALWITIGTIGTPAAIAMWKAPFLKRPGRGVEAARAFGRDRDREAVAQRVDRGLAAP